MDAIQRWYDGHADYEWRRLERHRMEFAVTLRALREHLPPPPARILDIGGGPGRYAISLSHRGYGVTLLDLSEACLAFARERAAEAEVTLTGCIHGSAVDLRQVMSNGYDAVLVMGPFYHLLTLDERQSALREAVRVLRPGGILAATFLTRYAPIRDAAAADPAWILAHRAELAELLAGGNLTGGSRFTGAHYVHSAEVRTFMEQAGLHSLDLVALEGVISRIDQQVNALTGELWDAWVDLSYQLGKDPCVHGGAEHLLYVGRK